MNFTSKVIKLFNNLLSFRCLIVKASPQKRKKDVVCSILLQEPEELYSTTDVRAFSDSCSRMLQTTLRPALVTFSLICSLSLLTGCGYHLGQQNAFSEYKTISVPYIEGDLDGDLTAAVVQAVATSGGFEYRLNDGALLLVAKVVNLADVNIGFRYDRHRNGELSQSIIPDETRLTLSIEFSLLEASSGRLLDGPVQLSANVVVDHDYNGSNGPADSNVNIFSLGQLSNADAAFEAAERPLNRAIARKIRDYLSHSW